MHASTQNLDDILGVSSRELPTTASDARRMWAQMVWGYDVETRSYPNPELCVSVSHYAPGVQFRSKVFPLSDNAGIWSFVKRLTAEGQHVYTGLGLLDPSARQGKGRGMASHVQELRVFVADVDIEREGVSGAHSAEKPDGNRHPLPDEEQGRELLRRLNDILPASMVVDTGYGFHYYAAVDLEGVDADERRILLRRWRDAIKAAADEMKVHVDAGVSVDPARVFRTPGSRNVKVGADYAPEVRIVHYRDGVRLNASDLDVLLPELAETRQPRRKVGSSSAKPDGGVADFDGWVEPECRRWLAQVDPTDLLLAIGWEEVGGRLKAPGTASESSGEVAIDDEGYALFVNSETVITDWCLDDRRGPSGGVKVRPFTILRNGVCEGSTSLADALVSSFPGDPDALVSWVEENDGVPHEVQVLKLQQLANDRLDDNDSGAVEDSTNDSPDDEEDSDDDTGSSLFSSDNDDSPTAASGVDVDSPEVRDLLAADDDEDAAARLFKTALERLNGSKVPIDGDRLFLIVGGSKHGIWQQLGERDDNGNPVLKQLTSWFAWRTAELRISGGDEVRDRLFDVEVLYRASGRVRRSVIQAMTLPESQNLAKVIEYGPDVFLPSMRGPVADAVASVLRFAGAGARRRRVVHTHMGPAMTDDGVPVYLAPGGSIGPDGPTSDVPKDTDGASIEKGSTRARLGWKAVSTPAQLREDALALQAFFDVAPQRPDLAFAVLGQLFAGPMGASEGGVAMVVGPPDSNKTWAVRLANSFLTPNYRAALVDLRKSSSIGVEQLMTWTKATCVIADDFRLTGENQADDERARRSLSAFVQSSYGEAGEYKGRQEGGIRARIPARYVGMVSAELLPSATADNTRIVPIHVAPGDIDASAGGAVDAFQDSFSKTGAANRLYGSFLQFLMRQVRDGGPLAPIAHGESPDVENLFLQSTQTRREIMYKNLRRARRAAETTATIALGWSGIEAWAKECGFEDLLPSEELRQQGFERLLTVAVSNNSRASHHEAIKRVMVDAIDAQEVWIGTHDGQPPMGIETKCGWSRATGDFGGWEHSRTAATKLGTLTTDRRYVLVTRQVLVGLMRRHEPSVNRAAIHPAMKAVCSSYDLDESADYKKGEAPRIFDDGVQRRGYPVPAELFGIEPGEFVDPRSNDDSY